MTEVLVPIIKGKKIEFKKSNNSTQFTATYSKNIVDVKTFSHDNRHFIVVLEDGSVHYSISNRTHVWKKTASQLHDKAVAVQIINENQFLLTYKTRKPELRKTKSGDYIKSF